jgi:hypothetical protein
MRLRRGDAQPLFAVAPVRSGAPTPVQVSCRWSSATSPPWRTGGDLARFRRPTSTAARHGPRELLLLWKGARSTGSDPPHQAGDALVGPDQDIDAIRGAGDCDGEDHRRHGDECAITRQRATRSCTFRRWCDGASGWLDGIDRRVIVDKKDPKPRAVFRLHVTRILNTSYGYPGQLSEGGFPVPEHAVLGEARSVGDRQRTRQFARGVE